MQVVRHHAHIILYSKVLAYRHRARGDERNLNFERPAFPALASLETGAVSASSGADGGNQSSTWNEASVRLLHSGMIERPQHIPRIGKCLVRPRQRGISIPFASLPVVTGIQGMTNMHNRMPGQVKVLIHISCIPWSALETPGGGGRMVEVYFLASRW